MARFRAYTSDSDSSSDGEPLSDDEKIPEDVPEPPEEDSDDESSSSASSDLREEELVTRPRPRNGLVEDENGDIQYAHEVSRPRADPTLIPWAQHIGVDAQKMHVMQTSLFRVPEEAAAMRAVQRPTHVSLQVPQPLSRKHSRDSDGDGLRFESKERASFAHDIEPPYRPSRKYARVESSESAVTGNEASLVDAGLAFGRSFRAGWGPDGTLVHPGSLCAPSTSIKTSANSSIISKTKVPICESSSLSVKLLQHQLSHSPIDFDDDDIPFANPSSTDLHFSSFAGLFPSTDHSFEASLFRLGSALFDSLNLRLGDSVTPDIRARISALRRKAALSAWLEDAVAPSVDADIRANPAAGPTAVAFMHLTGNQVDRASEVAVDGGYLKLATLISQAGGDFEFREDLKDQLEIWREQRIDMHIDESVRKVYALLAGIVDSVVEGSKGGGQDKCPDVDITAGLDWKRVLGLHLWFSGLVDAPISHIFEAYSRLVNESPPARKIAGPIPWYEETSTASKWRWKLPSPPSAPDALFSLIRLHAEPSCSLSHVLTPLSFGPSPLDSSLPWHLYIILSRCMRVRDFADRGDPGTRRTSSSSQDDDAQETAVEGHSPSADLLTSSYAFQLEEQGMLQEAVFVLLHLEGSAGREKAIKDLLARCAARLDEWSTRGIVGSLRVPMTWVQEAKAIHALDCNEVFEAYDLYLSAGLYNAAHDIAVSKLAPDAVIRNDLTLLTSLFSRFNGRPVDGWHVRGKAFLDYAHIVTRLPELEEELGQEQELDIVSSLEEETDELARNASKLIGILPDALRDRSDSRHNAALAYMIRTLMKMVDKYRPFTLAEVQPTHVDEAVKLQHIKSSVYAKFLKSIDYSA
ncbi:nuclear protein 96-domain-containing protein [Mycena albidolilacea]|uniref:Nuclear protein 96-domain-containing protein n=1 Tax=Mycena albidolilacea TaxID=1033008 RepID=A0AAD7EW88_9AGAR|nr:nuclear protein 96-domain-containing protein [Mycena albidolilacea]